jgi:hypothetical protein
MINTAIIASDHGLGHIRRSSLIAIQREQLGENVTLFAPLVAVRRLQSSIPSLEGIRVYDFNTGTNKNTLKACLTEAISWLQRLPTMDGYDRVICDNLPEILELRTDAVLSAQFFWHNILPNCSKDYYEFCESLLERYTPFIYGCQVFSMDCVRSRKNFRGIGMYKIPELAHSSTRRSMASRSDLLISGGSTQIVSDLLAEYVNKILEIGPMSFNKVHVDPQICPSSTPKWMIKAEFDLDMYLRLSHAICRPGLGTISDLLTVGALICPVYEENNAEMYHNHKVLQRIFPKSCFKLSTLF